MLWWLYLNKGVVYTGIHRILMSIHGIYGLDSIYLGIHAVYRASRQRVDNEYTKINKHNGNKELK